MKRIAQIAAITLTVLMLSYPLAVNAMRTWEASKRRTATIAELRGLEQSIRQRDSMANSAHADQIRATIDFLHDEKLPAFKMPRLFSGHVCVPSEGNPYLQVYWLEEGHTVDGVDIYIDGELRETLTGWSSAKDTHPHLLLELFANRYDRFRNVDFLPSDDDSNLEDWQLSLDPALLEGQVELQLRQSRPIGLRIVASNEVHDESTHAPKPGLQGSTNGTSPVPVR